MQQEVVLDTAVKNAEEIKRLLAGYGWRFRVTEVSREKDESAASFAERVMMVKDGSKWPKVKDAVFIANIDDRQIKDYQLKNKLMSAGKDGQVHIKVKPK